MSSLIFFLTLNLYIRILGLKGECKFASEKSCFFFLYGPHSPTTGTSTSSVIPRFLRESNQHRNLVSFQNLEIFLRLYNCSNHVFIFPWFFLQQSFSGRIFLTNLPRLDCSPNFFTTFTTLGEIFPPKMKMFSQGSIFSNFAWALQWGNPVSTKKGGVS